MIEMEKKVEKYIKLYCKFCKYEYIIPFNNLKKSNLNILMCPKCQKSEMNIITNNNVSVSFLLFNFMIKMSLKYLQKFPEHGDSWIIDYDPKYSQKIINFFKEKCIEHIKNNHFLGASLYCVFLNYLTDIKTTEDKEKFLIWIKNLT